MEDKEDVSYTSEIINQLALVLNFTTIEDDTKGYLDILQNLENKQADIGAGLFVMTNERLGVVDFSEPIIISRVLSYLKPYNDYIPATIYYKV